MIKEVAGKLVGNDKLEEEGTRFGRFLARRGQRLPWRARSKVSGRTRTIFGSREEPASTEWDEWRESMPAAVDGGGVTQSANRPRFAEQMFQFTDKEIIMAVTPNKDQVQGATKDIAGKIQQEVGKLVGSKEQQAKGLQKQAEGKIQKGVGNVKEAVADLKDATKK